MKAKVTLILLLFTASLIAQSPTSFTTPKGDVHLIGAISIDDLQTAPYQDWYLKNYDAINLSQKPNKWKKQLKNTTVDIYIGTWCGDSKKYVPRFIKLWTQLGLDPDRLNIIGLYNGDRTKQGPNGEEKGKGIHRVPTFIFNKDGTEYARIVERPVNDLETDIAQIATGYASKPSYRAASYMIDMFANHSLDSIQANFRTHINAAYRLASKSSELNTLGYVLLKAGEIDKALLTFRFNTRFYRYDPNVYDSYAEALVIKGEVELAVENYNKVLELDPENNNALVQLKKLKP